MPNPPAEAGSDVWAASEIFAPLLLLLLLLPATNDPAPLLPPHWKSPLPVRFPVASAHSGSDSCVTEARRRRVRRGP